MKTSRNITLSILTAALLAACSPAPEAPPTQATFTNVTQCVEGGNDKAVCEAALANAAKQTAENAPRFNSAAQCEQQFGAGGCQQSSGGWFVPALMGFMVANMLNNSSNNAAYARGRDDERRSGYTATPVYRTPSGSLQSASFAGGKMTTTPAATRWTSIQSSRASFSSAGRASTSGRGGFGSRAGGFSSGS